MRGATGLVFALFITIAVLSRGSDAQQPTPTPPESWPEDWFSWCVMSITKEGEEQALWTRGQKIVYAPSKQIGCRFEEQDLVNISKRRGIDFCDYTTGMRYHLNESKGDPPCAGQVNFGAHRLLPLTWPAGFLETAKFLGIDRVGDLNCNHFYSPLLSIDGRSIQFDAWTSVEHGTPCQISYFEHGSPYHYSWAFVGFQPSIPPDAWACSAARLQCAKKGWKCTAKPNVNPDYLARALAFVCDPRYFNCDPINPGGRFFEPNTLIDHCNWAFDAYFQANKMTLGEAGCDFQGVAQLVPPNSVASNSHSHSAHRDTSRVQKRGSLSILDLWPIYQNDLVCNGNDSPMLF